MARRTLRSGAPAVHVRRCDAQRSVRAPAGSQGLRRGIPRRYDRLQRDDDVRSRCTAGAARGDQPHARLAALLTPAHVHFASPTADAVTGIDAFGNDDLLLLRRVPGVRRELVTTERVPCTDEDTETAAVAVDDVPH